MMTSTSPHTAVLLIGASRGLGLAIAKEYLDHGSEVVATVRSASRTELHDLQDKSAGRLEIEHIDITIPEQIVKLHNRLASRVFDLLFVNAGVTNNADETIADVSIGGVHPAHGHQRAEPDASDRGARETSPPRMARSPSCPPDRAASPTTSAAASRSTAAPRPR
jgi:NAD(P)-dependent dehydrogenase (short-subunit alcohol dehydrogenase family)